VEPGDPPPVFLDPERRARLVAAFPAIDAYLQQAVARDGLTGLAAGIVIDGELAWFRGYGHRDVERRLPVEPDTVFGIGSITKTFTALAALRLRDEGRLDLDRPAATYLPALDAIAYPTSDSPRISIRHILRHTAGLPRHLGFTDDQAAPPTRAALLAALDGLGLDSSPGDRHVYSNVGFQLLGLLIDDVAGVDHRRYVHDAILAPLGMHETVWTPEDVPADRLAVPYAVRPGQPPQVLPHWRFGDADAAGALLSSVEDLARFASFNLAAWPARNEPEAGPLRRATLREAHSLSVLTGFRAESKRDAPALGSVSGIGLGFVVHSRCRYDVVSHGGKTPTYRASVQMLPNHGVALILLSNVGATDGLAMMKDGFNVLDLLADTGALEPHRPVPGPELLAAAEGFGALVGRWDDNTYARLFSPGFRDARPAADFAVWLAGVVGESGACRAPRPVELVSPRDGLLELACDRGGLQLRLQVAPGASGKIVSLSINGATGRAPAPDFARAAERVLRLVHRWNEREFRDLFSAEFDADQMRRNFTRSAADRGRCRLGPPRLTSPGRASFVVNCKRGAPTLNIELTATRPAKIAWIELAEPPEKQGRCR
jgi:CubicO group peptidase (beta-lactamase class C family)